MSTAQAIYEFRTAYAAMLAAAETVRQAVEIESGQAAGRGNFQIISIQKLVAERFGYGVVFLTGHKRTRPITEARHVAVWLCRRLTKCSQQNIAQQFGGRDHGTIIYAVQSIDNRMGTEPKFRARVEELRAEAEKMLQQTELRQLTA